jgi:hypothetical protein
MRPLMSTNIGWNSYFSSTIILENIPRCMISRYVNFGWMNRKSVKLPKKNFKDMTNGLIILETKIIFYHFNIPDIIYYFIWTLALHSEKVYTILSYHPKCRTNTAEAREYWNILGRCSQYRGADKSLARKKRKKATATEGFWSSCILFIIIIGGILVLYIYIYIYI